VKKGNATLIKKDIFKNLMWYILPDSNRQYPLTIERVRKIKQLNQQGIIPDELEAVEVTSNRPKEVEPEFVDVVGQISLRSLERSDKKRRHHNKEQRSRPAPTQQPPQPGQAKPGPRPAGPRRPAGPPGQQGQQGQQGQGPRREDRRPPRPES
jgi:hypothetical protein